ncbi:MAG TPA: hypothetical protein VKE74_07190, partial [Gemmataceae bacterium]|nr:hypothetical protein [Gemmataceae bacterium]
MKRLGMLVAAAAVILTTAVPAKAQQPNFTVTFGGQMRVFGLVWDNMTDFADTNKLNPIQKLTGVAATASIPQNKDSESYYFQRWRLYTTVESADKNAKVVWAIEVGDITWGLGGGANGNNFNGVTARTGNNTGGQFGADGVDVETKNLYLQFNIPWVPNSNILLGIHNVIFLTSPAGAYMDDDGAGIQLNFKWDPVDLQLYTIKALEGNSTNIRSNADDNDLYAVRIGFNLTPDWRFTLEGLVFDQQCLANRAAVAPAVGTCVSDNFADSYWVGGTAAGKIGPATLHGTFVYGNRRLWSVPAQKLLDQRGFGMQIVAQVPIGPVATWWHGWYTDGDKNSIVGGGCADVTGHPNCNNLPAGIEFATNSTNNTNLIKKSDKLPIPDYGASWSNVPFILEFIRGLSTIGAPGFGSTHYSDVTGTWGLG